MKTVRFTVPAQNKNRTIEIPNDFDGEDVVVTIVSFPKKEDDRHHRDISELAGIIAEPDLSLDDVRYDRLSGQMKRYKSSLKNTPGPVPTSQVPRVRIDYKRLLSYAKEKGVTPAELSQEEKMRFVTELKPGELE